MVTAVLDIIWHSYSACERQCISGNSHFVNSLSAIFSAHQGAALSRQNEINILYFHYHYQKKAVGWISPQKQSVSVNAAAVIEKKISANISITAVKSL